MRSESDICGPEEEGIEEEGIEEDCIEEDGIEEDAWRRVEMDAM